MQIPEKEIGDRNGSHRAILLARYYPPDIGGVASYCQSVARTLADGGVEVYVLAPRQDIRPSQEGENLKVIPIPIRRNRFLNFLGYFTFFYQFQRKMRIPVVLSGYWIPMGIVAWACSLLIAYRYGVFIYGAELWGYTSWWERWLMRACCRRAERLLPITRYTVEQLNSVMPEMKRLTVVPCTIDPDALEAHRLPEGVDAKESLGLKGKQVLLTVSALGHRKGHLFVLDAMSELMGEFPDLTYIYTGQGPAQETIEARTRRLGLEANVRAVGFVDRRTLMQYYQAADLFVMVSYNPDNPADFEGFGIVYLEAAYWGVPSVAARFGGPAEVIDDGVTGALVNPQRPEELTKTLRRLLRDPQERHRLGQAARAQTLEKYSPSIMAQRLFTSFFPSLETGRGDGEAHA